MGGTGTVSTGFLWLALAGTFPVAMALGVFLGALPYFHPVNHPHRAPAGGRHRHKP